jgi:hypothetical protein
VVLHENGKRRKSNETQGYCSEGNNVHHQQISKHVGFRMAAVKCLLPIQHHKALWAKLKVVFKKRRVIDRKKSYKVKFISW